MKIIENNLKYLRKRRGLTQREVAYLLGCKNEDRISKWEKGKQYPNVPNLFKLARIYRVGVNELYK